MTAPERPEYLILLTDAELTEYVGHPLEDFIELEIIPRFNVPGSCIVTCEAYPWLMELLLTDGTRAVVSRNGIREVAGPVETRTLDYQAAEHGEDGYGTVTWAFADDLAYVAVRQTYPNPAQDANAQTVPRYTITATNAEDAIRSLVNLNAGPGALSYRQVPGLILGTDHNVGSAVNYSTRFEPLLDACRAIAIAGGGLGFRTMQVLLTVVFEVYEPRDLSTSARFGRNVGNLTGMSYSQSSPTATAAIVGGQGEGAARVIRERPAVRPEGWRRTEVFVDRRDVDVTGELDAAGDDALAEGGATTRLAASAIDTESQTYRTDYGPGDIVSVAVIDGVPVTALIVAVEIRYTPEEGEVITPIIGTQDAIYGSAADALQAQILRRQQQAAAAGEIPV